jgi:hypothetical protein
VVACAGAAVGCAGAVVACAGAAVGCAGACVGAALPPQAVSATAAMTTNIIAKKSDLLRNIFFSSILGESCQFCFSV